jgi:hypothetical protein
MLSGNLPAQKKPKACTDWSNGLRNSGHLRTPDKTGTGSRTTLKKAGKIGGEGYLSRFCENLSG